MDGVDDPDIEVMQIALDHAWAWYAMRFNQYLHLLNAALLATAVFSAAYVAALSSHLDGVATGVALAGSAGSLAAAYTSKLIQRRADLAEHALGEIQDRLASRTGIDSMRMFATTAGSAQRRRPRHVADVATVGVAVAWLAAAVYAVAA
jgi:hypothetical protein